MKTNITRYLALLILFFTIVYYYIISIDISFSSMPLQIGLATAIVTLSAITYIVHHGKKGPLFDRRVLYFLIICVSISVITTNLALLSMFSIAMAYYLTYEKTVTKKLLKHFLVISTVCFLSVLILCLVGILPNHEAAIYYMPELSTTVSALGFKNPNGVLMFLLPIVAAATLYISDAKPKKKYLTLAILLLVTIVLFGVSGSRNGLIIILLVIATGAISSTLWSKVKKPLLKIAPATFGIFTVLSFILVLLFGKEWSNPVNRVLSFRPSKMFESASDFIANPTWISGQEVSGFPVDNLYLFVALSYGVLVLIGYTFVFWRLFKSETNIRIVVVGLLMLLYGVFEKFTMIPVINIFMPLATIALLSQLNNDRPKISRGVK